MYENTLTFIKPSDLKNNIMPLLDYTSSTLCVSFDRKV